MVIGIIIGVVVLIALYFMSTYNGLVKLRNMVKDQWAQIDVLLKRRADLIPNLVETVKGYAKHESETLEAVINARNKAVGAQTTEEEIKANGELTGALSRLFALAESYPDLKANTNFIALQDELAGTENRIGIARKDYNEAVQEYNKSIKRFPTVFIARMFGFEEKQPFKADDAKKEVPNVNFDE